jgi:hypothetical protein
MLDKTMVPRSAGEMRAREERPSPGAIGVEERQDRANTSFDANAIDRPSISVVIPTLNEAENLPHVLPAIPSYVDEVIIGNVAAAGCKNRIRTHTRQGRRTAGRL